MGVFLDTSTVNQISVCMPYGNGDLVSEVAGANAANGINNLTSLISNMNDFNNDTTNSWINGNLSSFII